MIGRVVYDTMIFLQAAVRPSRVHRTFQAVADGTVTLCVSHDLLKEVRDVLTRDTVRAKFPALTTEAVDAFLDDILKSATLFDPVPVAFTWPQHPDDDHLFNLAIVAGADYPVTWETRILRLATEHSVAADELRRSAPNLSIVAPDEFAQLLRRGLD